MESLTREEKEQRWQKMAVRMDKGAFLQKIVEPNERYVKLKEYQEEMRAFTDFLKARYFAS
jgi:hypothetical protein